MQLCMGKEAAAGRRPGPAQTKATCSNCRPTVVVALSAKPNLKAVPCLLRLHVGGHGADGRHARCACVRSRWTRAGDGLQMLNAH